MNTQGEKFIFGFLGAMTAVVVGLAVYSPDFQKHPDRAPASAQEAVENLPYFYFLD